MERTVQQRELFEPTTYHSEDDEGYFWIGVRPHHTEKLKFSSYPLLHIVTVLNGLNPNYDSFISQGEFFRGRRRVVNLRQIGLLFVDLDTYNIDRLRGLGPRDQVREVLKFIADKGIPAPSLIVFSGRGLQVKWLLERPIPQAALPRWNALQRILVNELVEIGADKMAKDASRVLRLVQTVNTKSGEIVRIMHVTENGREILRHNFEHLAKALFPISRSEWEDMRRDRAQRRADQPRKPKGQAGLGPQTLAWARLMDLRQLYTLRGGVPEGERMNNLFWRINFLLQSKITSTQMFREAAEIATEIDPRWNYRSVELSTLYERARAHERGETVTFNGKSFSPLYTPKNDTLIDLFQITTEEQKWMTTIIAADEWHRRRIQRRRDQGIVERSEYLIDQYKQRQERREIVLKALERHPKASQQQLAKLTGLNQSTISRLLKD